MAEFYRGYSAEMFCVAVAGTGPLPLLTYWFMGEGNAEYASELEIKSLSMPQINKRLKDMKKRLNTCCKGLLEAQYLSTHQYGLLSSSAAFLWRVDFIHCTVKEFLILDSTNELLQHWCTPGFNAYATICRALLAQMKTAPAELGHWEATGRNGAAQLYGLFCAHAQLWRMPTWSQDAAPDQLSEEMYAVLNLRGARFAGDKTRPTVTKPQTKPTVAESQTKPNVTQPMHGAQPQKRPEKWWASLSLRRLYKTWRKQKPSRLGLSGRRSEDSRTGD